MKRFTCIVLGLCATVVCAQDIVFGGEEAGGRHANQYISVDAQSAQPHSPDGKTVKGDVNTRFFPGILPAITAVGGGLLGGLAGGLIGGKLEDKFHGGYGYGGGIAPYAPYGGYGGYGGFGQYGGVGGYGGFGGIKPGRCSGGLFGGFRSASGAADISAEGSHDDQNESVTFTRKRRSVNDESVVVDAPGENVDARFIGGLFGIPCKSDYTCPGIQKCCFSGFKATCRNPVFY